VDKLVIFLTALVALSAAVERVVEIVKGYWPWLRGPPVALEASDGPRRAALQILSTVTGAGMALSLGPERFLPFTAAGAWTSPLRWTEALLVGLMASGGSGLWNHALDIVESVKKLKGQSVIQSEVTTAAMAPGLRAAVAPGSVRPPPTIPVGP
jgi:hypothetical protein